MRYTMILQKILKAIQHPSYIINYFLIHFRFFLPDRFVINIQFYIYHGKKLCLNNPRNFNEKMQWLKLYDRKSEYTKMVDKYEVRKYIADTIGEDYLIPLVGGGGIWDTFDDINFEKLPDQFVLKCTHDSASAIICKDKKEFDILSARTEIHKCLKRNFYYAYREWVYKNVKPRIIAEQYMVDESETELKDYKIFCFNGEPKIIQVDFGRFSDHKRNLYSLEWEYQPFSICYPTDPKTTIKKPQSLGLMLDLARKLSKNIPYLRVDLYSINEKIYFGELTFYHEAGYGQFTPPEWDRMFGDWLGLPTK